MAGPFAAPSSTGKGAAEANVCDRGVWFMSVAEIMRFWNAHGDLINFHEDSTSKTDGIIRYNHV